jgi:hypothetical protein
VSVERRTEQNRTEEEDENDGGCGQIERCGIGYGDLLDHFRDSTLFFFVFFLLFWHTFIFFIFFCLG